MTKNLLISLVLALVVVSTIFLRQKSNAPDVSPSASPTESPSPSPLTGQASPTPSSTPTVTPSPKTSPSVKINMSALTLNKLITLASGLQVQELKIGTGAQVKSGDKITVNYVGTLTTGKKFDSSYDRKEPFAFTLGAHQVIEGWDSGLEGMKVGGKRKLIIPPNLAYGKNGVPGVIPADATLVFEIELLGVGN